MHAEHAPAGRPRRARRWAITPGHLSELCGLCGLRVRL